MHVFCYTNNLEKNIYLNTTILYFIGCCYSVMPLSSYNILIVCSMIIIVIFIIFFFNGYDLMLLSNGLRRYNTSCRRYLHIILLLYWVPEWRTTMEIIR